LKILIGYGKNQSMKLLNNFLKKIPIYKIMKIN